jgi:hypothetical protein
VSVARARARQDGAHVAADGEERAPLSTVLPEGVIISLLWHQGLDADGAHLLCGLTEEEGGS